MSRTLCCLVLLLTACPSPPEALPEVEAERCGNGLDDDGDGQVDCQDSTCASASECQSTPGGETCSAQADCLQIDYIYDDPLPACVANRCQANPKGHDIRFEVNINALAGRTISDGSLNTRFVLRTAVDASQVTCEVLRQAASGATREKAGQLEASKRFNLLAFDVVPIQSDGASNWLIQPFLNTGEGSDFLVWTEVWSGRPDSTDKLPTGRRLGTGCVEQASLVTATGAVRATITQLDN